jgi:tRNA(His) 5'-end guanylyltransferase
VEAVVFAAFVFFVFVAFAFFVFVAFVVSCPAVSCANTGIANEKTIMPVKSSVRSFFMLGLDLLKDYFRIRQEQAWVHSYTIAQIAYNSLKKN